MLLTRLALFLRLVLTPVRVAIAFVESLFERYGMIPTRLALARTDCNDHPSCGPHRGRHLVVHAVAS